MSVCNDESRHQLDGLFMKNEDVYNKISYAQKLTSTYQSGLFTPARNMYFSDELSLISMHYQHSF